jgi:hypothetical protein
VSLAIIVRVHWRACQLCAYGLHVVSLARVNCTAFFLSHHEPGNSSCQHLLTSVLFLTLALTAPVLAAVGIPLPHSRHDGLGVPDGGALGVGAKPVAHRRGLP